MKKEFKILSINISNERKKSKYPVSKGVLVKDFGLENDAHGGNWHRQVSLLAWEDVEKVEKKKGIKIDYGILAENISTYGVSLSNLPIGTKLYIGDAILELTQIGKKCPDDFPVARELGDCVLPAKGVFCKVLRGGEISVDSKCFYEVYDENNDNNSIG